MKTPIKILVFVLILVATLVIVYAASYRSTTAPVGETLPLPLPDDEENIEQDELPFSIDLSDDWEHQPMQGIDSQVGEFTDGEITISYDYGWYGGFPVDPTNPEYASYAVEVLEVEGQIVRVGYPEDGSGAVAAYVQDEKAATSSMPLNSLALYADSVPLERLDEIIELMKSARLM